MTDHIHASTGCSAHPAGETPVDIELFLSFKIHNQGKTARTAKAYADALARLCLFMAGRDIRQASPDELTMFCGPWLHKQGVMAISRRPYIAAVREFFKWLTLTRRIASNPALGITYPRAGRKLPNVMSLASAEKMMWEPDFSSFEGVRDAAMLSTLIGCGLRVSGLVGLNQGNLLPMVVNGMPRLALRVTEKGNKERQIPVPREVDVLIRLYLDHPDLQKIDRLLEDGDQVLFVSTRNHMVPAHEYRGDKRRLSARSVLDRIKHYGNRAGIPPAELHPHALRHLFGTELAESGIDLLERQDLLGHKDPKHTMIYTHLAMRNKFAASDKANPLEKMKTPAGDLLARLRR